MGSLLIRGEGKLFNMKQMEKHDLANFNGIDSKYCEVEERTGSLDDRLTGATEGWMRFGEEDGQRRGLWRRGAAERVADTCGSWRVPGGSRKKTVEKRGLGLYNEGEAHPVVPIPVEDCA